MLKRAPLILTATSSIAWFHLASSWSSSLGFGSLRSWRRCPASASQPFATMLLLLFGSPQSAHSLGACRSPRTSSFCYSCLSCLSILFLILPIFVPISFLCISFGWSASGTSTPASANFPPIIDFVWAISPVWTDSRRSGPVALYSLYPDFSSNHSYPIPIAFEARPLWIASLSVVASLRWVGPLCWPFPPGAEFVFKLSLCGSHRGRIRVSRGGIWARLFRLCVFHSSCWSSSENHCPWTKATLRIAISSDQIIDRFLAGSHSRTSWTSGRVGRWPAKSIGWECPRDRISWSCFARLRSWTRLSLFPALLWCRIFRRSAGPAHPSNYWVQWSVSWNCPRWRSFLIADCRAVAVCFWPLTAILLRLSFFRGWGSPAPAPTPPPFLTSAFRMHSRFHWAVFRGLLVFRVRAAFVRSRPLWFLSLFRGPRRRGGSSGGRFTPSASWLVRRNCSVSSRIADACYAAGIRTIASAGCRTVGTWKIPTMSLTLISTAVTAVAPSRIRTSWFSDWGRRWRMIRLWSLGCAKKGPRFPWPSIDWPGSRSSDSAAEARVWTQTGAGDAFGVLSSAHSSNP